MYLRHGDISWDSDDDGGAVAALASRAAHAGRTRSAAGGVQRSSGKRLPSIDLHGVRLHALNESQCITHILDELDAGFGGTVVTPNLDHLRRCGRDLHFGALVAEADLVVADGMPLVWASRLQGTPLPERVAGSNLISTLSASAAERGRSVFLLGGAEGTALGAADVLRQRHPNLKIAGTFCPRIGFDKNPKQMAEIAARLVAAKPDIVYVALGSPKQEQLIAKLRPSLPGAWWLGVGVSFSFLTGHVRRAPMWMQRSGIEWVHRLFQEPRRLFKRYVVVGLPFATSLLSRAALRGIPNRLGRSKPRAAPASLPVVEIAAGGFLRTAGSDAQPAHPAHPAGAEPGALHRPHRPADRNHVRASGNNGKSLSRLKALVLLGGHVRPTPLSTSIGRSLLDLPLDERGSVLNHWLGDAADLGAAAGLTKLPVRVMVDRNSPEPISAAVKYFGTFRVERDQSEYRGTGGVLGDLAASYDDDDLILVANAAQILLDPLVQLAERLDSRGGDISLLSHRDGTPSGMMLVSCRTLRKVPRTGFVDMKEQAMPLIAQSFAVEVVHRRRPSGLPIRSATDYINAMRLYHMRRSGRHTLSDPLAEDWQPSFGIVEEGAIVDPTARVHDSIVLRGGVVEAGAVLVRSIVCPGALVRKERTVMDEFVPGASGEKGARPASRGGREAQPGKDRAA
jgi:N-acetylglucosaminyldiphosphoundecaprenol N-acetyl-beta-D-mannosaminyltransferase